MGLKDKKVSAVLAEPAQFRTQTSQYQKGVMPAVKLPNESPIFDRVKKGDTVEMWAEIDGKDLIIVARIGLNE